MAKSNKQLEQEIKKLSTKGYLYILGVLFIGAAGFALLGTGISNSLNEKVVSQTSGLMMSIGISLLIIVVYFSKKVNEFENEVDRLQKTLTTRVKRQKRQESSK